MSVDATHDDQLLAIIKDDEILDYDAHAVYVRTGDDRVKEVLVRVDLHRVVGRAVPLALVKPGDHGVDRPLRRAMIKPPEQRVVVKN